MKKRKYLFKLLINFWFAEHEYKVKNKNCIIIADPI